MNTLSRGRLDTDSHILIITLLTHTTHMEIIEIALLTQNLVG